MIGRLLAGVRITSIVIASMLAVLATRAHAQSPTGDGMLRVASSGDHVWVVVPTPGAGGMQGARIMHHAADMGPLGMRQAFEFARPVIDLVATGDRLWVVFGPEQGRPGEPVFDVASTTVRRNMAVGTYYDLPIGSMQLEPQVPAGGWRGIAALPGSPAAAHRPAGRLELVRPTATAWVGIGAPDANGDAIFNGAVDNETGTAGLIELARVWAAGPRPQRSIVMISFTAEESGLLGSEFYAANPVYPLATTVAGFNIDAMNVYGRVADVDIIGSGQSNLDALVTAEAMGQGRTARPDGNPAAGSYFRSDHFPLAKRGVPMAYVDGGGAFRDEPIAARNAARDEYTARRYHQADDEWSADWDLRGQVEDLELIFNIGRDLANSRDWPEWMPGSEFGPARAPSASQRR